MQLMEESTQTRYSHYQMPRNGKNKQNQFHIMVQEEKKKENENQNVLQ